MDDVYRDGWDNGYMRLVKVGKTFYVNMDGRPTEAQKNALIKLAEEHGVDRLMLDNDQGGTEKLWDNPASPESKTATRGCLGVKDSLSKKPLKTNGSVITR